jgi:glycosyltransferase involved in cell wall biosynthesis
LGHEGPRGSGRGVSWDGLGRPWTIEVRSPVRIAWLAYGDLGQPTGGYVYDRLVVEGLRAAGDEVAVVDPLSLTTATTEGAAVLVGDALCVRELGPIFEGASRGVGRVLLVHHFTSWELERTDAGTTREWEARAVAASDGLVATSVATGDRLALEHPGIPITVILPGADRLPRASRVGPKEATRVELLFVGSLVPRKRVTLLLDAIESLDDPRPGLTLMGDPGRDRAYAAAVALRVETSAALRECVTFAGVVSDEALATTMATADALVLPSSLEGYGMVLTEALQAGLPVLAALPAATAAGIAASPAVRTFADAGELAEILRVFVAAPALRASMRGHAERAVLPGWRDAIARFRRVLAQVQRRP